MITVECVAAVREALIHERSMGKRIALVPTMGALHEGHLSLVRLANERSDFVVLSIFVNPMQFNSSEDLRLYPRTIVADQSKCAKEGVDLLFCPSEAEIYPSGTSRGNHLVRSCVVKAGDKSFPLEGAHRPGHFDGVVTVVAKLFNIIQPDIAVFGEKDYQQVQVVKQMVHDLLFPVEIVTGPLIRESDGLAMSSRNVRLSAESRYHALFLAKVLYKAQQMVAQGERSSARLLAMVEENLSRWPDIELDYFAVVEAESMLPVELISGEARALIAAYVGEVRLIDNVELKL